jgi:hypothetical protein
MFPKLFVCYSDSPPNRREFAEVPHVGLAHGALLFGRFSESPPIARSAIENIKAGKSVCGTMPKHPLDLFFKMFNSPGKDQIRKICALVAASLILPALAYAGTDNGKGNNGQNNGNQYGKVQSTSVRPLPEANAAWVLVPIVGAVLLFSWRRLTRAKA